MSSAAIDTHLPLLHRVAALSRRSLGAGAAGALYRTPIAAPLRRALSSGRGGPRFVTICGGRLVGTRMLVDLACEKRYWLGTYEEPVQDMLARELHGGDVAYDVGAHAGFFSLLMSRLVGPTGSVIAFEPVEANASRLEANAAANAASNVFVQRVAVSETDGTAAFEPGPSTFEGRLAVAAGAMTVPSARIDTLVRAGTPAPFLIKLDVEGAEGAVVRGARETIAAYRPSLLVEVHSQAAGIALINALPVSYVFQDIAKRWIAEHPLDPGHYLGRPKVGV